MKKILIVPAVIGLLTVPSLALAHAGGADTATHSSNSTIVRHEDKQSTPTNPVTTAVDNDQAENQAKPESPAGSISDDQARTTAMGVLPDKSVSQVQTETEHGTVVKSVHFSDDSRVDVQASNGTVVGTELKHDNNGAASQTKPLEVGHVGDVSDKTSPAHN